jgi:SAM-dependent methyltransferase
MCRTARASWRAASSPALGLDPSTTVLEVGSGDGRTLRHFARAGIPVLGIEASAELAEAAAARGIPTEAARFGAATARRLRAAGCEPCVILGGDALGRAADPHDVAAGFRILLAPGGVLVLEFPHLLRTVAAGEFDAIHHGRVSYLSLTTAEILLAEHGLVPFAAEEVAGGAALRLRFHHQEDAGKPMGDERHGDPRAGGGGGLGGPSSTAPSAPGWSRRNARCSTSSSAPTARAAAWPGTARRRGR